MSVGHDYVVRGIFSTEEDARLAAFDNGAPSYGCQEPGNEDSWVFNAFPYEIDDVLWSEGYRTE